MHYEVFVYVSWQGSFKEMMESKSNSLQVKKMENLKLFVFEIVY